MSLPFDAVLFVSFGGPEGPDDVIPFLENVLRGKNVPHERMLEVAEHYQHFGGVSPLNEQNRVLIRALVDELNRHGPQLPVYWGNRNWHPLLADTLQQMRDDGVRRALAFVTSAYSCYSSCRQYLEDIDRARAAVAEAPQVEKLRSFYNHPGFFEATLDRTATALRQLPADAGPPTLICTAHSIPLAMAAGCRYAEQLAEMTRLLGERLGVNCRLAYQSRSGPPTQPWLEPDISVALRAVAAEGGRNVVVAPIGFVSDHMEVIYDLDTEAADLSHELGLNMVRAGTVGAHPRFVTMIRELIRERVENETARPTIGVLGPCPDICPPDCCPSGRPRK